MTTPQKDFLNMLMKVKAFFVNNAAAVAGFVLLTPMIAKVSDFVTDIIAADAEASRDITGAAEDKEEVERELAAVAADVAASLSLYYAANGDRKGLREVDETDSSLKNLRDSDLATAVVLILKRIDPVITAQLEADYNLTAGSVGALATKLDEYYVIIKDPQNERSESSAYNKDVDKLIDDSREHLEEKLDRAMLTYRQSNRLLWDYYQSSRLIDDTGSRNELSGFEVQTITINAGATIAVDTLPTDGSIDDLSIYFKNNGPGILEIGTSNSNTGPLEGTQNLPASEEILSKFSQTGLTALQYLLVRNPSGQQVVFKYGRKG